MTTRLLSCMLVLMALAGCTTVDRPKGYTRPECPQDYLTGPKITCPQY